MKKYRKKPVEIEAIQFTKDSAIKIVEWSNHKVMEITRGKEPKLIIRTLEGDLEATIGDFIIKGVKGEFYPCKPDIFEITYEEV